MKARITKDGQLIIECEDSTEKYALRKWINSIDPIKSTPIKFKYAKNFFGDYILKSQIFSEESD